MTSIVIDKKTVHLGLFREESDAAQAYNFAAAEAFGEFALFNRSVRNGIASR